MKDKITPQEIAQRTTTRWKFNQYDHGGSRSYIDGESGDRQLIIDTYYDKDFANYMNRCAVEYFAKFKSVGNQEDGMIDVISDRYTFEQVKSVVEMWCDRRPTDEEIRYALE